MRRLSLAAIAILLATACGDAGVDSSTTVTEQLDTTVPASPVDTTTTTPVSTIPELPSGLEWTVAEFGLVPDRALGGTAALGSGCSPGTDHLPDGVWFGWITDADDDSVDFDLACMWPGRLEVAVSNDAARLRTVAVANRSLVYVAGEPMAYEQWAGPTPTANAPGLPDDSPYWLFVNDGVATEITEHPEPISWARDTLVWPGLIPGCCDGGTTAPPSPAGPWPPDGPWPADGFYSVHLEEYSAWLDIGDPATYSVEIGRFLSCREHPEFCQEWWTGDEVSGDPDEQPLLRSLPLDRELTVVVLPISSQSTLVGDGVAYASMLRDIDMALSDFGDPSEDWEGFISAVQQSIDDPASPFGIPSSPDSTETWPVGYRGPGGTYLTFASPPWMVLEIRDGAPILYLHAGIIAG